MRALLFLVMLSFGPTAEAFTSPRHGLWIQAGGGLSAGMRGVGPGWMASSGFWWGNYDRDYALGRFWGVGVTARQDYVGGELATVPSLELRRGNDVIVAGMDWFLSAGPVIVPGTIGGELRTGVGGRFRFNPGISGFVRIEALGGYVDGPHAGGGLILGFMWSRPTNRAPE